MVFEKRLIRIKKNYFSKQQETKGILTENSLTWWENRQEHSISLQDIVGVCAVEDKLNQYAFVVNSYPLVSSLLFAPKRLLRQYKFACTSDQLRSQWLREINNRLYGQETAPFRRLQIILNPHSGKKNALKIFAKILTLFKKSNIEVNLIQTLARGHAVAIIQEINLQQIDGLVIIGGDGTIYEVINGLMSRSDCESVIKKIPIGIIPAGTGNGLCKSILDISGEPFDPLSAAFLIAKGKQQPLDLITTQQQNKQYHNLLSLSWGFVSDVDIESDKLKYLGSLKNDVYALLRIYHLRSYKGKFSFLPVASDHQWQVIEDDFILIWAMNTPWASHNLKPAPHAHLADGSIDVLIIRGKVSKWQLLSAFLKCSNGQHISLPYVEYYKVCALHLEPLTNSGIIAVDGEQVDYLPIQMEVKHGIVSVFCLSS